MKKPKLIVFLLSVHLLVVAAFPQSAKFDIVTYVAPPGWGVEKDTDAIRFTKADGGKYCVITILRSIDSVGSANADFEAIWKKAAAEGLNAKDMQRGKGGPKDGWQAELGIGPFEKDGISGAAFVTTYTGNGKVITIMAIANAEEYQTDIETFVNNVKLPPITSQKIPAAAAPATGDAAKLIGRWQRSSSGSPSYADPASWGTAGYTKSRYEFKADGTYAYTERSFRYSYQNIIVVKENGKYSVSGDMLTIVPAKSTITAYKKAGGADALGAVASNQNRPLEKVAYKFTFHYFSGIQEWNLVLQADATTQRDGQFSGNTTFNNAWYFDQKYTDTDLTAVRVN
jgi:hypothetical protein